MTRISFQCLLRILSGVPDLFPPSNPTAWETIGFSTSTVHHDYVMKAVCVCGGVHLPYSPKWYWPVEGFSGMPEPNRYFDMEHIFMRFQETGRELLRLNDLLLESIEDGGRY